MKTKFLSKIIIFSITLLLIFALVACNDSGNADTTTPSDTTDASPSGTTDAPAAPTDPAIPTDTNEPTDEPTDTVPEDTEPLLCQHSYKETIEVPAKILTNGVKLNTCELCGESFSEDILATKSIKLLAIGNSFSDDAMEYLWDILKDGGVEEITLGRLYIGSCTLNTHFSNLTNNSESYKYYKNTNGKWVLYNSRSIRSALDEEEWDIITLQQASGTSGVESSFSNLQNLIDALSKLEPSADIYWHMTWAYQQNSTHSSFPTYNKDQMTMYNAIINAVKSQVHTKSEILGVIPCGTSIQNLRTSYVGDTVTRDGYHMSPDYGRYTTALTWFAFFTGADPSTVDWVPNTFKTKLTDNIDVIRESVVNAINAPYEVTKSKFTEDPNASNPTDNNDAALMSSLGYDINNYEKIDWALQVQAYYNSNKGIGIFNASTTTLTNISNFIASKLFTKETLPAGSIIIVDEGYQYRPERWVDEKYVGSSSTRPGNVTKNIDVVTESWWDGYTIRAFNLGGVSTKVMEESDIPHLRIYIPKK